MAGQGGYAPRSPDLSAYHSGPAPAPLQSPSQAQYQPPTGLHPSYQPPAQVQYSPPAAPPYQLPAGAYQPPATEYLPPHGQYPPPAHAVDALYPPSLHSVQPMALDTDVKPESDPDYVPESATAAPGKPRGRKPRKPKTEEPQDEGLPPAPGVAEGIDVRTKFPVARIKRIMQADEDVGKVAQVTPTAVSKALELFMISLVTKSAAQARIKSAKKVTAAHLKQVILQDESFDFLNEIVSKIPDAPAPRKEVKAEDSDEVEGKKRKRRGKAKTEEEDW